MDEQPLDLSLQRCSVSASLAPRRLIGDYHVAKRLVRLLSVAKRERKHVGGRIMCPITPVELANFLVVDECNSKIAYHMRRRAP